MPFIPYAVVNEGGGQDCEIVFPGPTTPPVAGYTLWAVGGDWTLDADGRISQWNDRSGNGNDFTQATARLRPYPFRLPTSGFGGAVFTWCFMDSPFSASLTAVSRFVVARTTTFTDQEYVLGAAGGTGGTGLRLATDGDMETTTDGVAVQFSPTTIDITAGAFFAFGQIIGGTSAIEHRRNGNAATTATTHTPTASRTVRVGSSGSATTQPWHGDVFEMLFYASALTGTDIDDTMDYLRDKWGTG